MEAPAFPPHPSVEHLVTIFRRIDAGGISVPAFQRAFVWHGAQILELLESVYNGFPIGSILMWRVDAAFLRVSESAEIPFPRTELQFPTDFILDGLQRLSTLYGVFHFGSRTHNRMFDVVFDLENQSFKFSDDRYLSQHKVAMSSLFNPRALLRVQQDLLAQPDGDYRLTQVLGLQSRFQEYMLPIVTLTKRNPSEVVSIFERVNSTGTRLSRVDFMRAITWSQAFDLNEALDKLSLSLDRSGFSLSDDTLVKALALSFDLMPLPDLQLKLREKTPDELIEHVGLVELVFEKIFEFLTIEMRIRSADFIPYEAQLLVLFYVFLKQRELTGERARYIRSWLIWSSLNEYLQGRSDHFVSRLILEMNDTVRQNSLYYISFHGTDFNVLGRRRIIKGRALSSAFASLFAYGLAKSLVDGRNLPSSEYMISFETSNFAPIFNQADLFEFALDVPISSKILANLVFVPSSDRRALNGGHALDLVKTAYASETLDRDDVLESQLLPPHLSPERAMSPAELLPQRILFIEQFVKGNFEI